MTTKEYKIYKALQEINRLDLVSNGGELVSLLNQIADIDYNECIKVWEFLILDNEKSFASDSQLRFNVCTSVGVLLADKQPTKLVKSVIDNSLVAKTVFAYSDSLAEESYFLNMVVEFIMQGKLETAKDVVVYVSKNELSNMTYGEYMKRIVEFMFARLAGKSTDGKIRINKRVEEFLVTHIGKIKTSEKALLLQRIKEL